MRSVGAAHRRNTARVVAGGTGAAANLRAACGRLASPLVYPVVSGVPAAQVLLFFRQMADLVGAGLPLSRALALREERASNRRLKGVLADARAHVEAGGRLSEALGAHAGVFTELQVELLRAAEQGGFLAQALARLADDMEREMEFRRLLRRLTLYAKIVFVCAIFVIPAIFSLVMGGSLWIAVGPPLLSLLTFGLIAFGVFAVVRLALHHSEAAREGYERLKWALPGIGFAARRFALARFARAFAMLYAAGLDLPGAARVAGRASGSRLLARAAEQAAHAMERGIRLSEAFRATGALPPVMLDLLHTGETAGEVDAMLLKAAESLEADAETRGHQAAYVLSEVLYLLVALGIVNQTGLLAAILGGR